MNPNYIDAWYRKGIALEDLGRYEEAIKAHDKAIEIDPYHSNTWKKGNALRKIGRYEDAIKAYEKAMIEEIRSSNM